MVTTEDVQKIARLARLAVPDQKLAHFTEQLNQILGFMEQLNELDTQSICPTAHPLSFGGDLREDRCVPSNIQTEVTQAAPAWQDDFFEVPRVI